MSLPVAQPRLPPLAALARYLDEIDRSRHYSNYGPLSQRFEVRLAEHFEVAPERVVAVANGTLGLTAALMAAAPPAGSLCLVPAWTFVATAHAVRLAGLIPYLVDVEARSGALTPGIAAAALAAAPGPVGAVVPVLPFGQPLLEPDAGLVAWDEFADRHRLAVVVDAAAGFDAVRPRRSPVMVSLHATKVLGIGEGGVVIGPDAGFSEELRRRLNFGFYHVRLAMVPALNAKLSEYHAAVGHAALDEWPQSRRAFQRVALNYGRALADLPGVSLLEGYGERWVTSTAILRLEGSDAPDIDLFAGALAVSGIDTRQWWGRGLHRQPAFADCPRTPLPQTDRLAATTLGLPCFPDLSAGAAVRVARAIASAMGVWREGARQAGAPGSPPS
jgi:dTDP-4-amino-4,6-dideoxygalactose transaminase